MKKFFSCLVSLALLNLTGIFSGFIGSANAADDSKPYYTVTVDGQTSETTYEKQDGTPEFLDDFFGYICGEELRGKTVEANFYGKGSVWNLSGDCEHEYLYTFFQNHALPNAKITLNNLNIKTYDTKFNFQVQDPSYRSEIIFKNCKIDNNFQMIQVGGAGPQHEIDIAFDSCEFTNKFYYTGVAFGKLTFNNCKNIGRVNANTFGMRDREEYVLTITNSTFADNCTNLNPDGVKYPQYYKDGGNALVYGNGFSKIVFENNSWESTGEKIFVNGYNSDWPGSPPPLQIAGMKGKPMFANEASAVNYTLTSDAPSTGMVLFAAYTYSVVTDYYVKTILGNETTLEKVGTETKVEEFKKYDENGNLIGENIEGIGNVSINAEESKVYNGETYNYFTENDPLYSQVENQNKLNAEMKWDNNSNVLHLNYIREVVVPHTAATFSAKANLNGEKATGTEYTFVLKNSNGETIQTKSTTDGEVAFDEMNFFDSGSQQFTITQLAKDDSGIVYDDSVFTANVVVTKSDNGLTSYVYYEKDGKIYEGVPTFENKTVETPAEEPGGDIQSKIKNKLSLLLWTAYAFATAATATLAYILLNQLKNIKL